MSSKNRTGILQDLTTDLSVDFEKPVFEEPKRFQTPQYEEESKVVSWLRWFLVSLSIGIALVLLFRVTLSPTYIDGDSMSPTLENGQVWFSINKALKEPADGDIIRAYSRDDMVNVVKRVVASEGDELSITDKGIFVNGDLIDNSSSTLGMLTDSTSWVFTHQNDSIVLGSDQYFILGDNRDNSRDSRFYGLVSKDDIQTVLTSQAPEWLANLLH